VSGMARIAYDEQEAAAFRAALKLISDVAYAAGLARMRAAAETETGPVVDSLDLLVLR
jgi:hypothetical protein